MSMIPPGGSGGPLPVRTTDLLLVLIVSLGAVRLAGTLTAGWLGPEPGAGGGNRVLLVTLALLLFQALVMLGAIWALVLARHGLRWADLGLRPTERRWFARAVVIAVVLMPVVALVNSLVPRLVGEEFQNPQIFAIAPSGFSWFGLVSMTVMAGAIAPFAEEVAFRGVLYPWLRGRLGVPGAVLASALGFAALHGVPALVPALTVIGVALALVYERSGSLWPAVVTHGVFNTIMIAALYAALATGVAGS